MGWYNTEPINQCILLFNRPKTVNSWFCAPCAPFLCFSYKLMILKAQSLNIVARLRIIHDVEADKCFIISWKVSSGSYWYSSSKVEKKVMRLKLVQKGINFQSISKLYSGQLPHRTLMKWKVSSSLRHLKAETESETKKKSKENRETKQMGKGCISRVCVCVWERERKTVNGAEAKTKR